MKPTDEQQAAIDLFLYGGDLAVEAGAGTGKTATLRMMAEATDKQGQYVAFNKAIVEEAKHKMPANIACNTAHSLAYGQLRSALKNRLSKAERMRSDIVARYLGVESVAVQIAEKETKYIGAGFLASAVLRAITYFCQSADMEISSKHFPYIPGLDGVDEETGKRLYTNNNQIREYLLPFAAKAWKDINSDHGVLPFKHEYYLKMWQLVGPIIGRDFVLFDEAQDANPVMLAIVMAQKDAQKILVGDSNQQIYEFTGAVNALQNVGINQRTYLSQSFRFGPAIAAKANGVLASLDTPLRLRGLESIPSSIERVYSPDCYLTRTNARAVRRVISEIKDGHRPYLMGGAQDVIAFAKAAEALKSWRRTEHPDLACFNNWGEVQEYVERDPQGDELRLLVKLVDDFGADVIIESLERTVREENADIVISTAHKAKGREWHSVEIADDFPKPKDGVLPDDAELRLLYVAITRASHLLDPYSCDLAQWFPSIHASMQSADPLPTNGTSGEYEQVAMFGEILQ